jgi:hypothetical protein
MMGGRGVGVVTLRTITRRDFQHLAHVHQLVQGVVHGGQTDLGEKPLGLAVDGVGGQVDVLTCEDLSHNSSLSGEPPPPVPQPLDQLADDCLLTLCWYDETGPVTYTFWLLTHSNLVNSLQLVKELHRVHSAREFPGGETEPLTTSGADGEVRDSLTNAEDIWASRWSECRYTSHVVKQPNETQHLGNTGLDLAQRSSAPAIRGEKTTCLTAAAKPKIQ